jgi:hypothetical protein
MKSRKGIAIKAEMGRHMLLKMQQVVYRGHNKGHTSFFRARLSLGMNLVAAMAMRGIPWQTRLRSKPDLIEKMKKGASSTAHAATQSWNDA